MKLSEFDFDLPPDRIASDAAEPRDAARLLLVRRADGALSDGVVRDLPALLRAGDCLVLNQTRVLPARFEARRKSGGRVPGLFLREHGRGEWEVLLESRGRLSAGETLDLPRGCGMIELVSRGERGEWRIRVLPAAERSPPPAAADLLELIGRTPLPPYIRRPADGDSAGEQNDRRRYQTVYASEPGSVAAPTAGLHFTPELLRRIESAGVSIARVTLHVGLGTFQPVTVDDLDDHPMHAEWCEIGDAAAATINRTRSRGGRIVAVGTTSTRVLESSADADGTVRAGSQWTRLLIQPPYRFRAVDALLTNFHLPRSTLLALVYAFGGRDHLRRAYAHAIAGGYRFYSFGDAMLIA